MTQGSDDRRRMVEQIIHMVRQAAEAPTGPRLVDLDAVARAIAHLYEVSGQSVFLMSPHDTGLGDVALAYINLRVEQLKARGLTGEQWRSEGCCATRLGWSSAVTTTGSSSAGLTWYQVPGAAGFTETAATSPITFGGFGNLQTWTIQPADPAGPSGQQDAADTDCGEEDEDGGAASGVRG